MAIDVVAPHTLVDTDRYPVTDLDSPQAARVIAAARARLQATGAAELEGFVTPAGVAALVEDAERLAPLAHRSGGLGNVYLAVPEPGLPPEHPTMWFGSYAVGAVAYDLFPHDSVLRRLYEWQPLTDLIQAILDRGTIYPYADPFGALNLAVMEEGDQLQWHFDQADFVVSLAIRPSRSGGLFEVAPLVRSSDDERYDDVAAVLDGRSDQVEVLPMNPGTLLIFEGRHSLHRVSPIEGPTSRLVGLLAYDTKPGTMGSDLLRMDRYGRTEPYAQPPALS